MNEKMIHAMLGAGCVLTVMLLPCSAKRVHKHQVTGAEVFQQRCASCHTAGGNNVNPNRPVAGSRQLASLANFKSYLSAPPGHMPYYQDVVKDPTTLNALYKYCKGLKPQPIKQASNHLSVQIN